MSSHRKDDASHTARDFYCDETYASPFINPEYVEDAERFSSFCVGTPHRDGCVFDIPSLTLPPPRVEAVEKTRTCKISNTSPNKC